MNWTLALGVVLMVIGVILIVGHQQDECDGTLVRGPVWFECIEGDR